MKIEVNESFVEFICNRAELVHYPSLTFSIQIKSRGFGGYLEEVSFHILELDNFIMALENLELNRQGEAKLIHISDTTEYCPLRFKIFSIDKLGHLAIQAEIQKLKYMGNRPFPFTNQVSVTFEIEPGMLPRILTDFKQLFAERHE